MSGGQIAALICAIILLFPGGCFLFFGAAILPPLLLVAVIILGLAAWLFSFAFRCSPERAGRHNRRRIRPRYRSRPRMPGENSSCETMTSSGMSSEAGMMSGRRAGLRAIFPMRPPFSNGREPS